MNIILISLLSTILFGIIDALLFLIGEKTLQKKLLKISFVDLNMAEIITGALSSGIAIYIATYIRFKIKEIHLIVEHPALDFIGIMLGTIIILILYFIVKFSKNKKKI